MKATKREWDDFHRETIEILRQVKVELMNRKIATSFDGPKERRIGQDGFNWIASLDLDDPDALEKTIGYITAHAPEGAVFSELHLPQQLEMVYLWRDPESGITVRGIRSWDFAEDRIVRRVDLLFKPAESKL